MTAAKTPVRQFFVREIMKATKGKASPQGRSHVVLLSSRASLCFASHDSASYKSENSGVTQAKLLLSDLLVSQLERAALTRARLEASSRVGKTKVRQFFAAKSLE